MGRVVIVLSLPLRCRVEPRGRRNTELRLAFSVTGQNSRVGNVPVPEIVHLYEAVATRHNICLRLSLQFGRPEIALTEWQFGVAKKLPDFSEKSSLQHSAGSAIACGARAECVPQ